MTPRQVIAAGTTLLLVALAVVLGFVVSASPKPGGDVEAIAAPTSEPRTTGTRGPRSTAPVPPPAPAPSEAPTPAATSATELERTVPDCSRCGTRTPIPTSPAATSSSPAPRPPASPPPPPPHVEPQPNAVHGFNELVNRARLANGCGPVATNPDLTRQAQAQAERMAAEGRIRHSETVDGFNGWGENIAAGYNTAAEVHDAWMSSPEHRAIILDCSYLFIGAGAADGPTGRYWVEQLAS